VRMGNRAYAPPASPVALRRRGFRTILTLLLPNQIADPYDQVDRPKEENDNSYDLRKKEKNYETHV